MSKDTEIYPSTVLFVKVRRVSSASYRVPFHGPHARSDDAARAVDGTEVRRPKRNE